MYLVDTWENQDEDERYIVQSDNLNLRSHPQHEERLANCEYVLVDALDQLPNEWWRCVPLRSRFPQSVKTD